MKNESEIKAYRDGIKTTYSIDNGVNNIYTPYQKGMLDAIQWIINDPE